MRRCPRTNATFRPSPSTRASRRRQLDGYVFVKRGQTVDMVADVFSQAPLPHDLLLYAGVPKQGATDPTDLNAPDNFIGATFSQQEVNNGDGVVVTFSVPSKS